MKTWDELLEEEIRTELDERFFNGITEEDVESAKRNLIRELLRIYGRHL
jgi:hypothetical protein